MQNYLITGANRGIGLELTRQLVTQGGALVFATCRAPERADNLNELARDNPGKVTVLQLDVNDESSIAAAVQAVSAAAASLDVLINNAGIFPKGDHASRGLGNLTSEALSELITTNAVSPLIVTQACRDLLQLAENPRVVMISSGLGSVQATRGGPYAYRMSKAAMNMAARVLAFDGAMAGITTITTHPGWVQTDMGGAGADITATDSAAGLLALISGLKSADNGRFFRYDGAELDW
ncbi:MAG: SDR family oxidoreductase [Anaerolineae bacterium]|nr:SDR family oxidoreductase [Anaerolineae bacterium]